MTDKELAHAVRIGRREGFAQAFTVAFIAFLVVSPFLALTDTPLGAGIALAAGVLGALAVASVVKNREPDQG